MEVGRLSALSEEPVDVRDRLRVFAAAAPGKVRCSLVEEIARLAAEGFLGALEARATLQELKGVCKGYERELWLWLVGERTWVQCASGLEGRVLRRFKAAQP